MVRAPTWRGKQDGTKSRIFRLQNIGSRLTLCFALIIFAMLIGSAVLLWQFWVVGRQAERIRRVDEELILALQAHANLMSFYERLDALAHSEDTAQLLMEAEALRTDLAEDSRRIKDGFSHLPPDLRLDATVQPEFEAIQAAFAAQLDAITILAKSADWDAARLRVVVQVRELESDMSALVQNINRQVGQERAQALANIEQAQRRILIIVPATAVLILLFAGILGASVTRSITDPLDRLIRGTTALAAGDFSQRVSAAGTDEIARLGSVFNEMVVKLKALYRELQLRERYLSEAQQLSRTGSFGWRLSSGTIYWSDETFRIFQFESDVEPTLARMMERVHPEDLGRVTRTMNSVSSTGREFEQEYRLILPDRSVKHVHLVAHPLLDEEGDIEFFGAVMDVTERKRAEEERERLRQVEADLRRLNRVSALGELAASLSHELKQPIAAAITNANTSLRWLKRDPPVVDQARKATLRMVKDANRAAEIIDRLRSLYKKGAPEKRELVDMNEVLREMVGLLHNEANRYSVSIRTELDAQAGNAVADRVQLQQVLLNLMLNAIDAMKETGGSLTVRSQRGPDGHLTISVIDTGVGLPLENAERIFDAFFTTKPEGTGMGLRISRSIVEAHGGHLWATANSGRGAIFHVTLPATLEAAGQT